jgi:pyrroloquinoline quinone biosynthesis protein B
MRVQVLGTAAGGGVPQWNCACPGCSGARLQPDRRRRHACLAVRGAEGRCYLVNATPDIGDQIEACRWTWPGPGGRQTPLAGVLLTDAELDHTLGITRLREADEVELWATPAVRAALTERLRLEEVLSPYTRLSWRDLRPGSLVSLGDGVRCDVLPVSGKRPRYAAEPHQQDRPDEPADPDDDAFVVALRLANRVTGGELLYAPALGVWPAALDAALERACCVIIDGTFWDDEEPVRAGISSRTATEMGHLPIEATLERLAALPCRVLYTHLNNSNPLVDPAAPQHKVLAEAGVEVAAESMVIEL